MAVEQFTDQSGQPYPTTYKQDRVKPMTLAAAFHIADNPELASLEDRHCALGVLAGRIRQQNAPVNAVDKPEPEPEPVYESLRPEFDALCTLQFSVIRITKELAALGDRERDRDVNVSDNVADLMMAIDDLHRQAKNTLIMEMRK